MSLIEPTPTPVSTRPSRTAERKGMCGAAAWEDTRRVAAWVIHMGGLRPRMLRLGRVPAAMCVLCVSICAGLALAGCGGTKAHGVSGVSLADAQRTPPGKVHAHSSSTLKFFSWWSFWNQPVSSAPIDPHSAALVSILSAEVAAELRAGVGPWINTVKYSVPIYTVPANQPTVKVKLIHAVPVPALQAAWDAVPLPAGAHPASGTDGVLVVWQPSADRLWEFERLAHTSSGWHATWGGAMLHVSSNAGVYGPAAWPGAKTWWGVSASSLSVAGGLITLEDLKAGQIEHALAIAIPNVRAGVYALPAKRSDGISTNPLSLPEGAHLRLNPNLNLATLHLPPLTRMIAEAAQRYGIYVRDRGANVQFFAQDPTPTGKNPYIGQTGYFEGKSPPALLAAFPWSQLEVVQMELRQLPEQ